MTKPVVNVSALFQSARKEGTLSAASLQALLVPDLGAQIQAGLGVTPDNVTASEMTLVTMMPDDSGSMRFTDKIPGSLPNSQAVRDGHNLVIQALKNTRKATRDSILVHNRYLNGSVLYPYSNLDQVVDMDTHNYDPNQGTPLYDQTVVLLGTVLAKAQEFIDAGVMVRTCTLVMTDGADLHSVRADARTVKKLVEDMLKEETHIIAAMGFDDGGETDFRRVFREMGIRDEWILTPSKTPSEIRRAFQMFSQSAVRASQNAGSFSQTAAGGFGSP